MKMVVGPGGALYVSGQQGTVYRIDPATGGVISAASTSFRLGGLGFTTDYKSLIVASDNQGLQALDVRGDGTLAPARAWRPEVKNAEALAADACGNMYAIVENDSRVWRVSAAGKVEVLADAAWRVCLVAGVRFRAAGLVGDVAVRDGGDRSHVRSVSGSAGAGSAARCN